MSKKEVLEGEVIDAKSRKSQKDSTPGIEIVPIKFNRLTAVLVMVVIICVVAFALKLFVGIFAFLLQFALVAAAVGLIGMLVYNFSKGEK